MSGAGSQGTDRGKAASRPVRVRAGGLTWRVAQSGPDGAPPLLLLHGFTGRAESWNRIVAALPRRLCLAPDLPGHGKTDPPLPPDAWRMPRLADALIELLDELRVGAFDAAGYSMGGRAALHLASRAAQRLSRLVLIGATPGIESPQERFERAASDSALARMIEERGIEAFVDHWEGLPLFEGQRALPPPERARIREIRLSHDPAALAAALRAFGTGSQEPLHGGLRNITAPTLIVAGEQDGKFRETGEVMRARIPGARMEIVPGAGHDVPSERPDALAARMESFLTPIAGREE